MARDKTDEDLDLGIEPEKGSRKKLIIIIAAVLFLLIGGGAGVAWFLLGGDPAELAESKDGAEKDQKVQPAIYYPMDPVFVVNLPEGGKARLLQTSVQVMARQQQTIDFVQRNDPMIRHNLLNLFGSHSDSELSSRNGKAKLQTEVIKRLNQIIKEQGGSGEIEAVYFTSFVMQ